MSVPSYIINWEEFTTELAKGIKIDSVNIDTSAIEEILETNFPEIIDLLQDILAEVKLIRGKYEGYNQKIRGINFEINSSTTIQEFIPEQNIYITGVAFSHNNLAEVGDSFDLSIANDKAEIIFSQVAFKDALQHKHFNRFFPVPAGTIVKITHYSKRPNARYVWYDLEFLEWTGGE